MAGKVLTEEDFVEGETKKEDTSISTEAAEKPEAIVATEPDHKEEPSSDDGEPQLKPSDDKKYKYASLDEYDKAYKEAERKMHQSTTKAAELERKLSQYEKPPEKPATMDDRIKEMTKDTLGKIRLLPADAPDREDQAGYLWSKLQSDITDIKYDERSRAVDRERDVVKRTYDYATKEGIKSDAELRILGYEFSKTDPGIPIDDRISMAVSNTKEMLGQIRTGFVEKQEKDKKEKEDLKVLGRGSSRQEKSETRKPENESMSQALSKLNEQRRMKKEDLRY